MHPIRHFRTITRHRHRVIAHCFRAGIGFQGLFHDLSKYSPREFWVGARFYEGVRSPNVREREVWGYSAAWMHHKGRNRHHFEYWTDYVAGQPGLQPIQMPIRYVAEMFCDRVAASEIYQGAAYTRAFPLEYYRRGKPGRVIHPETAALLESLLTQLADEGEAAVFARLRGLVKESRRERRNK